MTESINEMIQLIYYDLSFNENFEQYIKSTGITSVGKQYNTVAIIGCQSSGKSTLLNNLFNTNFEVMVEDKGRGQTTQGIWVAMNTEYKVMVLDCEGTDSKERGEDRFKFEHCSSLFALALADVLVINMWTNDVGRYTASNYGVLKIVFEMNLKLFHQQCAKRIMIVLRDFDEKFDEKEKIAESIMQDIHTIWREIKKPEKYKDYTPDKFFEFEFTTLHHKFYFEDKFIEEIGEMRKRLDSSHNHFIFKHVSEEKQIPMDGLSHYCRQIWFDIVSNKDLNIPSQKEMLANYRCNEIKDLALASVEQEVDLLVMESTIKQLTDFSARCKNIQSKVLTFYDDTAKNYVKHVYEEIRRHMILQLSQKLYVCFDNQAKKMIPVSQKNMRIELENELKKNYNFFECAVAIKKKYLSAIVKQLENIKSFDFWEISVNEYEELFDEIIENQRKNCLEEKKNETVKKLRNVLEDVFIQKLEEISLDFWVDFNQEYFSHYSSIMFGLKDLLRECYKMDDDEFIPYNEEIEIDIYVSMKKDFNKKTRQISDFASESFKKHFNYDEGIPRVWNKIDEAQIERLYNQFKKQFYFVFDIFRKFKLLRNPLKYFNYDQPTEENFGRLQENVKLTLDKADKSNFEDLLTEIDIQIMKVKYVESIEALLEDAKRRHSNIQKQTIPLWIWVLIIYLGYEDVIKIATSYWIIPVIIILAVYGSLHAMGMGHVPKMAFSLIQNSILPKFNKK